MSYIVHGGPLFWGPIAAAVVAVLAWRWLTHRHFHLGPLPRERYVPAHAPGGGVSPRAAAGSDAPGGGDAGDFPAGRAPRSEREDGLTAAELAAWREMNGPYPQEPTEDFGSPEDWPGGYGPRHEEDNRSPGQIQQVPRSGRGRHSEQTADDEWADTVHEWWKADRATRPQCAEPDLEPLPLPDYLPAPAAVHYAPDVPQAAECGPDHAYDDLYRDAFQPQPKGDAKCWACGDDRCGAATCTPDDDCSCLCSTWAHAEPEPQTVTDMRPVPARVADREHAISRIRLKAHVSVTLARKPPLRQYVEDVIGISPEEDWEQLLAQARAGGSDE